MLLLLISFLINVDTIFTEPRLGVGHLEPEGAVVERKVDPVPCGARQRIFTDSVGFIGAFLIAGVLGEKKRRDLEGIRDKGSMITGIEV